MQDRINFRVKRILLNLCRQPGYITIAVIAQELGVSAKTILRELTDGEEWLFQKGCSLSKKPGAGIKIDASEERKKILAEILANEKEESLYSPQERQIVIISELLQNQEPVKLYSFAGILKVTESTISNDLDKVEQWFQKQDLKLIRKPGLGVYIEGTEKAIRKAMIHFIYENTDENKLLSVIRSSLVKAEDETNIGVETRRRLLNLIDEEIIKKLQLATNEAEQQMGYKLADNAYIGLIVHMALAIQRIRKGDKITMHQDFLNELKDYAEYRIAESMAKSIAANFSIDLPESEIGYITMHLKGSKNFTGNSRAAETRSIGNFELVTVAKEIIKIAEEETGQLLTNNQKLLIDLVNHLGPAISRLKMNMDIRNPLLEEVKEYYPKLLAVSKKCATAVEKRLNVSMPESEVAYLAMHIGAAAEQHERMPKVKSRCVIACATGMGTARLLAAKLEKDFTAIQIVDIVSALYLEDSWLSEKSIDFIISTIKIEQAPIPVVTVNPLLFAEDKERIAKQLTQLENKETNHLTKVPELEIGEKIRILYAYNLAVLQILDNFFIQKEYTAQTINEVIECAVKRLIPGNADLVERALKEREEKGGTFISGHQFVLLHCKTRAVAELYFGIVKISSKLRMTNSLGQMEQVSLGIIMIAPHDAAKQSMETMGYISRQLVENEVFLEALRNGEVSDALGKLSQLLWSFHRAKYYEIMEG